MDARKPASALAYVTLGFLFGLAPYLGASPEPVWDEQEPENPPITVTMEVKGEFIELQCVAKELDNVTYE